MTVMSGCGGAPVMSMTVTCVIATPEATAATDPANAAASAPHSTTNALMSYSSRLQIERRRCCGTRFADRRSPHRNDRSSPEAQSRVSSSRHCHVYHTRHLRRFAMEGKRRNPTHDRVGRFDRHYRKVRVVELAGGGESVEPTRASRQLPVRDQPARRRGVNTLHQGLISSQHAAVPTEGFERGFDVASLG